MERKDLVTFKGNPLTLVGNEMKVGDKASAFTVLDKDLTPVSLSDFSGKVKIISVTPSLDTPVCNLQATTFNEKAQSLSPDMVISISAWTCPLPSRGSALPRGSTD